ncbi:hypothetical protein H0H87_005780 [Tephrocybe sp. NHM501043]|nr:hypothetical protein H0H87_005780 [Tephrocybe sp. NHM501043]
MYRPKRDAVLEASKRPVIFADVVLPHVMLPLPTQHTFVHHPAAQGPISTFRPSFTTSSSGGNIHDGPLPALNETSAAALQEDSRATKSHPFDNTPPEEPTSPRLRVELHSRQRSGEMWPEFSARLQRGLEKRMAHESRVEREAREARAKAAKNGYTKRCTVFEWEQDNEDLTFWRRHRLTRAEVPDVWPDYSKFQRKYWSHLDEWDLCGQLPRYPPGTSAADDDDDDYDDDYEYQVGGPYYFDTMEDGGLQYKYASIPSQTLGPSTSPIHDPSVPSSSPALAHTITHHPIVSSSSAPLPPAHDSIPHRPAPPSSSVVHSPIHDDLPVESSSVEADLLSLEEHLQIRYGFNIQKAGWTPELHSKSKLSHQDWEQIFKRLLFHPPTTINDELRQALAEFYNITTNINLSYVDLPKPFDLPDPGFICDHRMLECHAVDDSWKPGNSVYILRPGLENPSRNETEWFILVRKASLVLMAYRTGFFSMLDLARFFLSQGVAFRTVLEVVERPKGPKRGNPQTWASLRGRLPPTFRPSKGDYQQYLVYEDRAFT